MTADPDQLTWYRMDPYYELSGCERYTVSGGYGSNPVYSAWRKAKPMAESLGVFYDADDAKAACQADADKRAQAEEHTR